MDFIEDALDKIESSMLARARGRREVEVVVVVEEEQA